MAKAGIQGKSLGQELKKNPFRNTVYGFASWAYQLPYRSQTLSSRDRASMNVPQTFPSLMEAIPPREALSGVSN